MMTGGPTASLIAGSLSATLLVFNKRFKRKQMAEKVFHIWVGYLLVSRGKKLFQNPKKILGPYVEEGRKVLDINCAKGFFSLPLAQTVGSDGKVVCVDGRRR
jgi:ubiquinone/menaquinone biosynthesis C-methylase UbiE